MRSCLTKKDSPGPAPGPEEPSGRVSRPCSCLTKKERPGPEPGVEVRSACSPWRSRRRNCESPPAPTTLRAVGSEPAGRVTLRSRVAPLLAEDVAGGGDPDEAGLARRFAARLGAREPSVRRVLAQLREAA